MNRPDPSKLLHSNQISSFDQFLDVNPFFDKINKASTYSVYYQGEWWDIPEAEIVRPPESNMAEMSFYNHFSGVSILQWKTLLTGMIARYKVLVEEYQDVVDSLYGKLYQAWKNGLNINGAIKVPSDKHIEHLSKIIVSDENADNNPVQYKYQQTVKELREVQYLLERLQGTWQAAEDNWQATRSLNTTERLNLLASE